MEGARVEEAQPRDSAAAGFQLATRNLDLSGYLCRGVTADLVQEELMQTNVHDRLRGSHANAGAKASYEVQPVDVACRQVRLIPQDLRLERERYPKSRRGLNALAKKFRGCYTDYSECSPVQNHRLAEYCPIRT